MNISIKSLISEKIFKLIMNIQKEYCAVLVYGDIGRSPRMQYHTAEISKNTDFMIYFIGYDGRFLYNIKN